MTGTIEPVHVPATYWPHTQRLEDLDTLMRDPSYSFADDVDVGQVTHSGVAETFGLPLAAL